MSRDRGFTLIELLVVIAIIGVLAAIAIPQYAAYRQRGFDARAEGDLRNAATAEEAYYADNAVYRNCTEMDCPTLLPGLTDLSGGVLLSMSAAGATFTGSARHPKGSGVTCHWDSGNQGLTGCS